MICASCRYPHKMSDFPCPHCGGWVNDGKEGDEVPKVDLNTVTGLLAAIGNHGGMLGKLEFYDEKTGKRYIASAVYAHEEDEDTTVVDIKECDFDTGEVI